MRRFSSTVSVVKVPRPSGTWAILSRTISSVAMPLMSLPSNRTEPSVRTMLQMARSVVVLPAPLAPSRVVMPPASIAKPTSYSDWVWP